MARFEINNVVHKPDIRGTISLIGRAMITLGLILLLFVAYQLWGTNVFEARSQKNLKKAFAQKLDKVKNGQTATSQPNSSNPGDNPGDDPTVTSTTLKPGSSASLKEKLGEPLAEIQIAKIGLDHIVVSGTDKKSLQKGPGHYMTTPLPGQFGNAAIAGHRTTYGAPFSRLDELDKGDKIVITTVQGKFTYIVSKKPFVVKPSDVSVISPTVDKSDPTGKKLLPTLTLTTCHPKYSAAQRLVITADLSANDLDRATVAAQLEKNGNVIDIGNDDDTLNQDGIGHSNILVAMAVASFHLPLLWWLLLLVTVGCIWWGLFKRFHNWRMWIVGSLPFAVALIFYFYHLEHALPSNI